MLRDGDGSSLIEIDWDQGATTKPNRYHYPLQMDQIYIKCQDGNIAVLQVLKYFCS